MNTYIWTGVVLLMAVIASRGKAFALLSVVYSLFSRLFRLPHQIEMHVYKQCEIRANNGAKTCPVCEKVKIRMNDSICPNCKLEISLGRDSAKHQNKSINK